MSPSSSLSLLFLSVLSLVSFASASSACLAFDTNWDLLAFGFGGKDFNVGTQDSWSSSGHPTDITTSGRPPFDGPNATCYLSQFFNAVYVLGADTSDAAAIYIYDATAKSWSKQETTPGNFNPSSFNAILDHDTNVFYALSGGTLFSLDMGSLKTATGNPIPWDNVQTPAFAASGYQPVMALAQNHVHFLNVPGLSAGQAQIFVIHFSYVQPNPQLYQPAFPASHGQAASFFLDSGVQQQFAFIPDDGSATWVINVETNTTQSLAGPSSKDPKATYFASTNSLVQLTSDGTVSFLPFDGTSTPANAQASWSKISKLSNLVQSGSTSNSSSHPSGTSAGAPSASKSAGSNSSARMRFTSDIVALITFVSGCLAVTLV
ncbi:hypothetical protein BDN72DRAFT_770599 [Pluteus cervinus]|uniref:Uncharacterized protein n=1 Tax=Pluteus cervinus TaxID=181527 RepID=A0ACD3APA7_9AGAR|nr:hypothetical protein BDN72DRAFT_770599 [Pluteus cervinus]